MRIVSWDVRTVYIAGAMNELVKHMDNNKPQRSQLREQPKNRWWNCVQRDIKQPQN